MGQSVSHDRKGSRHEKSQFSHKIGHQQSLDYHHDDIDEEGEHPTINSRYSYVCQAATSISKLLKLPNKFSIFIPESKRVYSNISFR